MPAEWDTKETSAHVVSKEKLALKAIPALVVVRALLVCKAPVV